MLLIQLLTVAHVIIHIGNKVCLYGSLQKLHEKLEKCEISILYLEKAPHGTTKSPFTPNIKIVIKILMF